MALASCQELVQELVTLLSIASVVIGIVTPPSLRLHLVNLSGLQQLLEALAMEVQLKMMAEKLLLTGLWSFIGDISRQ